jgi:hypothetical protein
VTLRALLDNSGPSFNELREAMREAAAGLSVEAARTAVEEHALLEQATRTRSRVLALCEDGLGHDERTKCDELIRQAVDRTSYIMRPGAVEELWYLDALLDRLLR